MRTEDGVRNGPICAAFFTLILLRYLFFDILLVNGNRKFFEASIALW